jgi:hypothetical protein
LTADGATRNEVSRPEKLEIGLVEQSHLPTRQTLDKLGIARRTFARWYARYLDGGPEALEDRSFGAKPVWNRLPDDVRKQIIDMALENRSSAELAMQNLPMRSSTLSAKPRSIACGRRI